MWAWVLILVSTDWSLWRTWKRDFLLLTWWHVVNHTWWQKVRSTEIYYSFVWSLLKSLSRRNNVNKKLSKFDVGSNGTACCCFVSFHSYCHLFTQWYELSPLTEVSPPVWLYNCAYNDIEGCSKGLVIRNHFTFVITAPVCVTDETLGQIWYFEGDTKNRD